MFPAPDTTVAAGGALRFDWTRWASATPVDMNLQAILFSAEPVNSPLPRRALVFIIASNVDKVILAKAALRVGTGGHGLGNTSGNASVFAGLEFWTAVIASISDGLQLTHTHGRACHQCHFAQLRSITTGVRYFIPLGSRIRTRLATEFASRDELLACLEHLLAGAGNASLMTAPLRHTLCDHAAGNYRILTTMAAELLAAAAQKDLAQLDEKLYMDVFAPPAKATQRRAASGR